jgi:glutamine cyclotransferase
VQFQNVKITVLIIISAASCLLFSKVEASTDSLKSCNIRRFTARIVNTYPHARRDFTQGLVYESGIIYESTGLYGHSAVKYYGLDKPAKLVQKPLSARYFGEGLTIAGDYLVQLTYKSGRGFVYRKDTLKKVNEFQYSGEGWGLAYDGVAFILSDGSDVLRVLDERRFNVLRRIKINRCGRPIDRINELEYINGVLYANIWQDSSIVMIDPENGEVVGEIDLKRIVARYKGDSSIGALNGIAWDNETNRLFITGKNWPHLYQIELVK